METKHGTASGYKNKGCRCSKCKAWKQTQNKNDWARMKANGKINPALIPHGTGSGYRNWGCRCELCTKRAVKEVKHWKETGTMVLEANHGC